MLITRSCIPFSKYSFILSRNWTVQITINDRCDFQLVKWDEAITGLVVQSSPPGQKCHHPPQPPGWQASTPPSVCAALHLLHLSQPWAGRDRWDVLHNLNTLMTRTSILMLNCPSLSSIASRMTWMAVLSLAIPSVRSRVVVVITYCGGAIRLIWRDTYVL